MDPFRGSQALTSGALTRSQLRTRYRPVFRGAYIAKGADLTAATKARAAWLATGSTLAGLSAAAVLGAKWLDASAPAEIVRADRRTQRGIVAHSYQLADDEVRRVRGIRVTTPARTAFDIGRGLPVPRSVPIIDALLNATRIKPADITAVADRHRGARGIRRLRAALDLADGGAGLPRRRRRSSSDQIALLEAAGWYVIRVSAEMLSRPDVIIERVKAKLAERWA